MLRGPVFRPHEEVLPGPLRVGLQALWKNRHGFYKGLGFRGLVLGFRNMCQASDSILWSS